MDVQIDEQQHAYHRERQGTRKLWVPEDSDSGYKIVVTGFPNNTTLEELTEFLKSHCSIPLNSLSESNLTRDKKKAFFLLMDKQEAMSLQKLSGIRMKREKLILKYHTNKLSMAGLSNSEQTKLVRDLVASRYNAEKKFLNISACNSSGTYIDFNNPGVVKALFREMQTQCPQVQSLNLASNRLRSLSAFRDISKYLHHLENLSFENNQISDLKQLSNLKDLKLREIVFKGNPVCSNPEYQSIVRSQFPTLKYLDREENQPIIQFNIPSYITTSDLPEVKDNFFDSPSTQQLVLQFLKRYFEMYDAKRAELLYAYHDNSIFSLTISESPASALGGRSSSLGAYIPKSRNLLRVSDTGKRDSLLQKGRISVMHMLTQLPGTKHALNSFKIDALIVNWGTSQLLTVHVHGQFWELESNTNRSFDRIFLLAPSTSGTRSHSEGWPAVILNDQLNVRNCTAASTAPSTMSATPATSTASPIPTESFGFDQNKLLDKFRFITGMKMNFAKDCLEKNGWDYDKAVQNFYQLQHQLPPEAFENRS